MPVWTRNPRVNFLLLGRTAALIVCHAMSMAMTVVLPAPVANSKPCGAVRAGLIVGRFEVVEKLPTSLTKQGLLPQPDGSLHRLDLAEERPKPLNLWCRQC